MNPITENLLSWYDAHARSLPWRPTATNPVSPYQTWISEIMLQQTRVETVIGYYQRFLERFPTVRALAEAPLDDVLKAWEGLGYYSRARNLHQGAKQIVADFGGELPADVEALRKISGIGPYTAGAIASIAFGLRTPAVDGNVIRVVSRVRGIRENVGIPSVRRSIEEQTTVLIPADRPGDFNQALMDLGASICTPGTPDCLKCPLQSLCSACAEGDAEELPVLPRKNPPQVQHWAVCLVYAGDRILMRQRTETLLNGLWVFPMIEGTFTSRQLPAAAKRLTRFAVSDVQEMGEGRHVFTHRIWEMRIYAMQAPADASAPSGYRFVPLQEMKTLAIPTAMKAAVKNVKRTESI